MQELLAVALGGSIGAVSRYLVTNYIFIRWHCHWPWATFIVNAAGCLAMGFLMVLITEKGLLTPYWRLLLCVGFLGGLTTFSSFSYESLTLLSEGNLAGAGFPECTAAAARCGQHRCCGRRCTRSQGT